MELANQSKTSMVARWDWKLMLLGAAAVIGLGIAKIIDANGPTIFGAASALIFCAVWLAFNRQRWAVALSAGVLWANIVVFAFLTIPDREQSLLTNEQGLNWPSAGLALYFLICLYFLRQPTAEENNPGRSK